MKYGNFIKLTEKEYYDIMIKDRSMKEDCKDCKENNLGCVPSCIWYKEKLAKIREGR